MNFHGLKSVKKGFLTVIIMVKIKVNKKLFYILKIYYIFFFLQASISFIDACICIWMSSFPALFLIIYEFFFCIDLFLLFLHKNSSFSLICLFLLSSVGRQILDEFRFRLCVRCQCISSITLTHTHTHSFSFFFFFFFSQSRTINISETNGSPNILSFV